MRTLIDSERGQQVASRDLREIGFLLLLAASENQRRCTDQGG